MRNQIVSAMAIAMVAGTAAQAQLAEPQMQLGTEIAYEQPIAVAPARLVNGVAVRVGEWIPYRPAGAGADLPDTSYFDCFEADATGAPTGFCTSGCDQAGNCPAAPAGSRWYWGTAYSNPFHINDMTVLPAAANAQSTKVRAAYFWGLGTLRPRKVAIFTSETFNDNLTGPPGSSGDFAGVIYTFADGAGNTGHRFEADLTGTGLFHQMPVDGSGAYIVQLLTVDPVTGLDALDGTLGTQPFLWGTGEDETPPDGRVGTSTQFNWDDDFPTDGQHTVDEYYDSTAPAGTCPTQWGGVIHFLGEPVTGGGGCYPNCDLSTNAPVLNVADFTCFLQAFAAGASYANCDNSTTAPTLNVADFTCFLQSFAAGCP